MKGGMRLKRRGKYRNGRIEYKARRKHRGKTNRRLQRNRRARTILKESADSERAVRAVHPIFLTAGTVFVLSYRLLPWQESLPA